MMALMDKGNFILNDDGSHTILTGVDAEIEIVKNTLKAIKGEWFYDQNYFVDYLNLLDKPFLARNLERAMSEQILKTGVVKKVFFVIVNLDRASRKATTVFYVLTNSGQPSGGVIEESIG